MRKFLMLSLGLILAVFSVNAQDQKAKTILDEVSQNTRSYQTISAGFIFSMDNKEMDIHEKNEGSIKLKGQKYVVDLPDVGMKIYSDGKSVWNYMEDGNQVTISSIDSESSELMNPSALFNIYEQGFKSKYMGEKTVDGNVLYDIELYPDTDEHEVSKINLLIDKVDMMIDSATLYGTDGNLYGFKINELKTNVDLPDSAFVFDPDKYEDLEVIDFR